MRAPLQAAVSALFLLAALSACGGGGGGEAAPDIPPAADYYVDAAKGSDAGLGTQDAPFRTITHALTLAEDDEIVRVLAGTYDRVLGEAFPILVPPGVTLLGNPNPFKPGAGVLIWGSGLAPESIGTSAPLFATIIPGERSTITGLTVILLAVNGTSVTDAAVAAAYSGATIRSCDIRGGGGLNGVRLMNGAEGLRVQQCRITGAEVGLVCVEGSGIDSLVERTTLRENRWGAWFPDQRGGVDLGGGGAGSAGGNVLAGNRDADVVVYPGVHVMARHNFWDGAPGPSIHVGGTPPAGIDIWRYTADATIDAAGAQTSAPPVAEGS